MPKATTPTANRGARRHNPLEDDILATGILRNKPAKKGSRNGDEDEGQDAFVDSKASKNILRIGRELAEEENAERAGAAPPPLLLTTLATTLVSVMSTTSPRSTAMTTKPGVMRRKR